MYDNLVCHEDYNNNIEKKIFSISKKSFVSAIDIGAGTGRLASILSKSSLKIVAADLSFSMISTFRNKTKTDNLEKKTYCINADSLFLPFKQKSFDIAVSGWSICHIVKWNWPEWEKLLYSLFNSICKLITSESNFIIFETLGTGYFEPGLKDEKLLKYYEFLQKNLGFTHSWIRTDYRFKNYEECRNCMCFFFGNNYFDEQIFPNIFKDENNAFIVPECTGVWNFSNNQ